MPWAKIYDSTIIATNQGAVRRGAASVNLDINHQDIKEYLQIRRPKGDPNRQCLNLHQCVVVDDSFMRKLNDRGIPTHQYVVSAKTDSEMVYRGVTTMIEDY